MAQDLQYKALHNVAFPPFSFFCEFVCREARTRNDSSFALPAGNQSSAKLEQPAKRQGKSSGKECHSDTHIAALHPGPPSLTSSEHGWEGEAEAAQSADTSKCTDVCGGGRGSRSCSKICLAKVYPDGHPERAVKLYIILDEQSNRSLARTEFFDLLNVKGASSAYTLRTCAGVTETTGRRATGFIVESLDGVTKVELPTLFE